MTPRVERSTSEAVLRGLRETCPKCGEGALFKSYLKVVDTCAVCGEDLHHQRADDAPAYFTILIVAHLVGAGILFTESTWHPETWVQLMIWLPLLVILCLALLPRIKGILVGVQWAQRMHGFGETKPTALKAM